MMGALGGGLVTDMVKNNHHTSPQPSNSPTGAWNGRGGGPKGNQHLSGLPVDRNVDGNRHLNPAIVSEAISRHHSGSDIRNNKDGHSAASVAVNGRENGNGSAHNVNLTSIGSGGDAATISNATTGRAGVGGGPSLPSSSDNVAENVTAETSFKGFAGCLEVNCSEQGQGSIGSIIDSGLHSYKRANSSPPVADNVFNWPQPERNNSGFSDQKGGMGVSRTGSSSAEVGCTTTESISQDYYCYDYEHQGITYSPAHIQTHSVPSVQQIETVREMAEKGLVCPEVSFSSEPQLSALGSIAAGSASTFATDSRASPVGFENLYRGGDQDMRGGGDERGSIFVDGPGARRNPHDRHRRATTLMPGAVLEYPPGHVPNAGSPDFFTDIMRPSEFPTDGTEREPYIVVPSTVSKGIDSQGFGRPVVHRQPSPASYSSDITRGLPQHSNRFLNCIATDDPTERQHYASPTSPHKQLRSGDVYDDTLVARRDSYEPGNNGGRGSGGVQQGQQEMMDLKTSFGGLVVSKPSKSHATIRKERSFSSLPVSHQQDYDIIPQPGFKTPPPFIGYDPLDYRPDHRNYNQRIARLDVEPRMTDVDSKTAEPQVVQPTNAYYIDPIGPGVFVDPSFQYRPHPYAEPAFISPEVGHRRISRSDIVPMVHNLSAHPLAYYPQDPRSTAMSAPPGDPMYHSRSSFSPNDESGYEIRTSSGQRQKPYRDRPRDRDRDVRDRPRDRSRVNGIASSTGNNGRANLLEAFLGSNNGRGRHWELSDIQGQVVQFCRDQHGSRFIQQKLEVSTVEGKEMFFEEILPHVPNLITDVFGNYVIQKLFDHGTASQQERLVGFLSGHAVHLSLQMYGCRVVQKALEFANLDTLLSLVKEFRGHVMKCVQDQNGNHVIQKCIEVVSRAADEEGPYLHDHVQFIIDVFSNHVHKLSTHAYGCRVIQRILEFCVDRQRDVILAEIRSSFSELMRDQYGNYVIQHVLKHGKPKDRNVLMEGVQKNLLTYSQHKFASNVVEKCLEFGTMEERGFLINHVFTENVHGMREGQKNLLQTMVCDPYANYVVQKMLDVATPEQRGAIITEIRAHSTQLRRYTFGKYIISRVEKLPGSDEGQ